MRLDEEHEKATSKFKGKSALVTGGSRGIGRAIATRLARDGATVAVHYRRGKSDAEEIVARISESGGNAFVVGAELASPSEIEAMFEVLDAEFTRRLGSSRLDILVNNAAISETAYIEDVTPASFDRMIAVNLRGPYFVTQNALRRMGAGGRVMSVSSNATRVAYPEVSVYSMTKAAIQNLMLSLAQQLGPRGITVNTVVPGVIDTDMNANWLTADARKYVEGLTALKRLGSAEEVANVAAFLASDDSSWVTAQSIEASGGCRL